MKPVYIVLAGLPGSGKSTLRATLLERLDNCCIVLSSDDYIEESAKAVGMTYSDVFPTAAKIAEKYVAERRAFALRGRYNVIHDQTNLTVKSRSKRIEGLPETYSKVCLFVEAPEAVRQSRLLGRPGKIIPPSVDLQMRNSWQEPTLGEGFVIVAPGRLWEKVLAPWLH